jgi:hypothetical protein
LQPVIGAHLALVVHSQGETEILIARESIGARRIVLTDDHAQNVYIDISHTAINVGEPGHLRLTPRASALEKIEQHRRAAQRGKLHRVSL